MPDPVEMVIARLKKEIADRQTAIAALLSVTTIAPIANEPPAKPRRYTLRDKRPTIGRAAAEILKPAGRPMHGLSEILPALESRGLKLKHRARRQLMVLYTFKVAPNTASRSGMRGRPRSCFGCAIPSQSPRRRICTVPLRRRSEIDATPPLARGRIG